ncbi:MAG: pirin family protein [Sandaracinaceae bacterium]|nr:pirin family protein [Sandaracinaceae bacterium]
MSSPILRTQPLGFPWETSDPFLFCVHHDDAYPAGNEEMGPAVSLEGRVLGQDFAGRDGFRMYHGEKVPGFPPHPHRGFETVTIGRQGFIDHSDSLGATARFGAGDVQWMTAGRGVVHSEMFPLRERDKPNPVELFQIWLNLPAASKLVEPHFSMFWNERVPTRTMHDANGRTTEVRVVAGRFETTEALPPPPKSWAANPNAEIAIWTIKMAPNAQWTLPAASEGLNRNLYFFRGATLRLEEQEVSVRTRVELRADTAVTLVNGLQESELLLLQGRPIGEPVVQYGPFVMNSPEEIQQAFSDYRRTQFGGWPWPSNEPVHARAEERFAIHADGRKDKPAT